MNVRLLHETLLASSERVPEREAVVAGAARLTYGELLDRSLRLARGLQELGVGRGDRVAVFMDNSAGCATAIYGTLLAGGVFVVVNPQTKEDKLLYVLDDCEAAVLLTEGSLTRTALAAAQSAASVKAVVADGAPEGVEGALAFDDDVVASAEPEPRAPGTIPLDLAALIYTSGSTGFPKGVMMTHQSMVFAAGSIAQYLRLGPDERILGLLPLAFDYGLYQLLMNVLKGGTLVLERSFAFPAQIVKRVQEEEATVFPGVPTVYATLLSMRRGMEFELPTVRRVTNTAAALPATFHGELARIFPNALLFAMYGLTECKRVSYLEPELLAEKPTSVGKAIPGTETMVLREDGTPVEPGETGVLYVRGPHVMAGYWRKPEQTAEMLVDGPLPGERMLCAQDHFTLDEDGFLYFVGRSDDIIKTRGEKVSPIEVENAIFDIDGVKEAAVIGVPDEILGQAIRAFVVLDDGATLSEQEIVAACRTRLENFMVPQAVEFRDSLPTTATGKVRRKSLRGTADVARG
jgi:amino acid adenylation domain-containing protein